MANIEQYIPQKGNNQFFKEIKNFCIRHNVDIEGEGFFDDYFGLGVRDIFRYDDDFTPFNNQDRDTGDERIRGVYESNNVLYFRTSKDRLYRISYSGTSLECEKIYDDDTGGLNVNAGYNQSVIEIPYLTDKDFDTTFTSYDYNTKQLVIGDTLFSSDDVGKYIYFEYVPSGVGFSSIGGQYVQISEYVNTTTVVIASDPILGVEKETLDGDPLTTQYLTVYESINNVLIFNGINREYDNQGDTDKGFSLMLNDDGSSSPEIRLVGVYGDDIAVFDNRVWTVEDGLSVAGSILDYPEIIDSTTVVGSVSKKGKVDLIDRIRYIKEYNGVLLLFQDSSISTIRPIATENSLTTFYGYSNISGIGLFNSPYVNSINRPFVEKNGTLYVYTRDERFGILQLKNNDVGYNIAFLNQGYRINNKVRELGRYKTVFLWEDNESVNITSTVTVGDDRTYIYKYLFNEDMWFEYNYDFILALPNIRFYGTEIMFSEYAVGYGYKTRDGYDGDFINSTNVVTPINQELRIVGPQDKTSLMRNGYLQQILFKLFYSGTETQMKCDINLGGSVTNYQQLSKTMPNTLFYDIVEEGGDGPYSEIVSFKVGKGFSSYFDLTISNVDKNYINIDGVEFQYVVGNPYITPIKNTF